MITWGGIDKIGKLAQQLFTVSEEDRIENLTAGRWNEEARIMEVMGAVMDTRPLAGYGFSGLDAAYDSLWTEVMIQAGLLGALLVMTPFIALITLASRMVDKDLKFLTIAIVTVLLGTSLGLPTITSNRVATVAWLIITLIVLENSFLKKIQIASPLQRDASDKRAPVRTLG